MVCCPMPDMFDFPTKCPDIVKAELRAAFALFWSHLSACAGRIRVALECLMTPSGVQRRRRDKNGTYFDLPLHARNDAFSKREPNVGFHLMALKWLGNAGSQNGEVRRDDLLDAFRTWPNSHSHGTYSLMPTNIKPLVLALLRAALYSRRVAAS
jgi:hypothetical protein